MKPSLMIVVIAAAMQVIASIYFALSSFEVIDYEPDMNKAMNSLFALSSIGFLIYFVSLMNKGDRKNY